MIGLYNKSKHYGFTALKVLLLSSTFFYLFFKVKDSLAEITFPVQQFFKIQNSKFLILFFLLASLNWFFEILKWQTLVSQFKSISFLESTKQSLSSLTLSLITPNRIGEYGVKAFYFKKKEQKKVLMLNLIGNSCQLFFTVLFAIFGLWYISTQFSIPISILKVIFLLFVITGIFILMYTHRKKEWFFKNLSFYKMYQFQKNISFKIRGKVLLFSFFRYLIFSFLFFNLLLFFGAKISTLPAMALIFSMYFLSSVIPSFAVFDVVIKGGIAVWLFGFADVPNYIVVTVVFYNWILNFILPAILGSYFVITQKKI